MNKIKLQKFYKKQYKKDLHDWGRQVLERDKHICFCCGKIVGKAYQPHHILPKEVYKDVSLDINNGILLCFYCHKKGPSSPHLDGLNFIQKLKKDKLWQYEWLIESLELVSSS